jgi:hypothetical protein
MKVLTKFSKESLEKCKDWTLTLDNCPNKTFNISGDYHTAQSKARRLAKLFDSVSYTLRIK